MKPPDFPFKKSIWLLPLVIAVCTLLGVTSCKDEKKPALVLPKVKLTGINATCVELSKAQIESEWISTGQAGSISYIGFYTSYNWLTGGDFTVHALAFDINNNRIGNSILLTTGTSCNVMLPPLSIGENIINMSELDILDGQGQLKDFEKILLTPRKFVPVDPVITGEYLQYEMNVISKGGPGPNRFGLPCPPCQYCKPPNCDTVIIDAPLKKPGPPDTTGN
ncbi:MAG: hypothetical protein ACT4OJ_00885 [Bacteroidota bacterium]